MPAVFLCKFNVLYDIMSSKKFLSLRKIMKNMDSLCLGRDKIEDSGC